MELPPKDALDIFRGWRDKASSVTFFLDGTEALVKIRGVVTEVFEAEILVTNEVSRARLSLENATFEYQDRREAAPLLISESEFVCCIEVCLPTDSRCYLFELGLAE